VAQCSIELLLTIVQEQELIQAAKLREATEAARSAAAQESSQGLESYKVGRHSTPRDSLKLIPSHRARSLHRFPFSFDYTPCCIPLAPPTTNTSPLATLPFQRDCKMKCRRKMS
jgi:hypothetical protein